MRADLERLDEKYCSTDFEWMARGQKQKTS